MKIINSWWNCYFWAIGKKYFYYKTVREIKQITDSFHFNFKTSGQSQKTR